MVAVSTSVASPSAVWVPKSNLAKAVDAAGFTYDPGQDIIYSKMDAWQRRFGYTYFYDVVAPVTISALIDCEPFFFSFGDKEWMIELWKGQYGLETGGEIGVYNRPKNAPGYALLDAALPKRPAPDTANSKFFNCVSDDDRLTMSFKLLAGKGATLFTRERQQHWWLTGFKWGVLSAPEDLTMELTIEFPNGEMLSAFVKALDGRAYRYQTNGNAVSFAFAQPKSQPQPRALASTQAARNSAWQADIRIVKAYQAAKNGNPGFKSNDPNLVPDAVAGQILSYFQGMEASVSKRYAQIVAAGLRQNGVSAAQVASVLGSALPSVANTIGSYVSSTSSEVAKGIEQGVADIKSALGW